MTTATNDKQEVLKKLILNGIENKNTTMIEFAFENGFKDENKELLNMVMNSSNTKIQTCYINCYIKDAISDEEDKKFPKRSPNVFMEYLDTSTSNSAGSEALSKITYEKIKKDLDDGLYSKKELNYYEHSAYNDFAADGHCPWSYIERELGFKPEKCAEYASMKEKLKEKAGIDPEQETLKKVAIFGIKEFNINILNIAFEKGLRLNIETLLPLAIDCGQMDIIMLLIDKIMEGGKKATVKRPLDTFITLLISNSLEAEKELDRGLVSKEEINYLSTLLDSPKSAWEYVCDTNYLVNRHNLLKKMIDAGALDK